MPTARPRLKPHLRPIRRGAGTVQLGVTAESGGILVAGLVPSEIALLERLDGSLTEAEVYALAAGWGIPRHRAAQLLRLLRDRRLLLDGFSALGEPSLSPPSERRHVVVAGAGSAGRLIAAALRDSGVGKVDAGPWAADLAEAELRDPRRAESTGYRIGRPQLVVLVFAGAVDGRAGRPWHRAGVPVLPVLSDGVRAVVGPLVRQHPTAPCLQCVELTRAEREVAWPEPATGSAGTGSAHPGSGEPWGGQQWGGQQWGGQPGVVAPWGDDRGPEWAPEGPPLDAALGWVTAGLVAMLAGAVLTGDAVPWGVSLEVGWPWPRLDHRRWERHPGCPAHTGALDTPPCPD